MELNKFLLGSGASIDEINCVRKQLSRIKGGKLAQAIKGEFHTLIISDVVGDDPSIIASGPTVEDSSTGIQALNILTKYNWQVVPAIAKALLSVDNANTERPQSAKHSNNLTIMANARQSIDKAITTLDTDKWQVRVLNYDEEGDANQVAEKHAAIALETLQSKVPTLLLSGGELTVKLNNMSGQGGPNQQYMLALAIALKGTKGIAALACDTDGIDGNEDVAGAFIDESTLARAEAKALNAHDFLAKNDSFNFFGPIDDLIITGPTHTNVNDFRVIMIDPSLS